MRLSTKTRYGTRALVDLALHGRNNSPMPLKDIAERQGISLGYLEHIIIAFSSAGLINSVRGVKGGISLARPAGDITLKEIVEILEGPTILVDCLRNSSVCPREGDCVTQDVWDQVGKAMEQVLVSTTLQDLVDRETSKSPSPDMYYI
jgi:Rrf2 family transcriptional regulator, cysteine metabolism repressor